MGFVAKPVWTWNCSIDLLRLLKALKVACFY